MGFSRWMQGGNTDNVAAGDEVPKAQTSQKFARGDSLSTCDSDSSTSRDVRFSRHWQEDLLAAVRQMRAASTEQGCILVTDALGIELLLEDKGLAQLASEHFPLRVRLAAMPSTVAGFPRSSPPSEGKGSSSSVGGSSTGSSKASKVYRGSQVSLEIEFGDVWPGILTRRLEKQGVPTDQLRGDGPRFLVATDNQGIEVDLQGGARHRMPSPDRFPLKLHFHAPRSGPQNIENCKHPGTKGKEPRKNNNSSKAPPAVCEHSMELALVGMLSDIVDVKLEDIGVCLDETMRSRVLITDCLGIVVDPAEGVPDKRRFPIKAHVESALLTELESNDGGNRWFGRRPSTLTSRMTSACESAVNSFRNASGTKSSK